MAADGATTWILTASPENDAATAQHGFTVIGCKELHEDRTAGVSA